MGRQIPRILLASAVVVVCLTGLMAVSALVPDVGCSNRVSTYREIKTRLTLSVPLEIPVGQPFSVNGTLVKEKVGAIAGSWDPFPQQRIQLHFAGKTTIVTSDDEGRFTAELSSTSAGSFNLIGYYPGDRLGYYTDSGDSHIITLTGKTNTRSPPNYSWLTLMIILVVAVAVVCAVYLAIAQKRSQDYRVRSAWGPLQSEPRRLRRWLPIVLTLLAIGGIIFAAWPRPEAPVRRGAEPDLIPTMTTLKAPAKARPGKPFMISGRLARVDNGQESPLPSRAIEIMLSPSLGSTTQIADLQTDGEGNFTTEIVLENPGQYEIGAVFRQAGTDFFASSDSRDVTVGERSVASAWNLIVGWSVLFIGLPLAIVIALGCFLYLRRHRRARELHGGANLSAMAARPSVPPPTPVAPVPASASPVKIDFPQIPAGFPNVWGKGESLVIVFSLEGERHLLEQYSLDIELAPGLTSRVPLGPDSRVSEKHTYRTAGQYDVKAALVKETRNGYVPASTIVRVVDYREEIVSLYNNMIATLKSRGVSLSPKMTAREVEGRLVETTQSLPRGTVREFVSLFEEANYSLHSINRTSYEGMYVACSKVEQYARENGPHAPNLK